MTDLFDVFIAFVKAGLFGFGGGPSMIPLIEAEVVGTYGWLSREDFIDAFAFGNSLPGPIATKLAGYVGFQVAGVTGAVAALIGVTAPTILAMIALASLYSRFENNSLVQDFLRGVRPVIVALLAVVVWEFAPSALRPFNGQFAILPWAAMVGTFLILRRRSIHPSLVIGAGGALGVLVSFVLP